MSMRDTLTLLSKLDKWDDRYIQLAKHFGTWSKDTTKVGAVAVGLGGQILSQGYNGFPRGVSDSLERLSDRATKLRYVVHAEHNCIYNAGRAGVSLAGAHLYVHGVPVCNECAKGIVQSGFSKVYSAYPEKYVDGTDNNWTSATEVTRNIFSECGITHYEFISN